MSIAWILYFGSGVMLRAGKKVGRCLFSPLIQLPIFCPSWIHFRPRWLAR